VTTAPSRHERPARDRHEAIERLRRNGGRLTPAKHAVLDVFVDGEHSCTAEALIEQLPQFDPATIYRVLGQFEEARIIEHVHLGHGAATYRWAGAATLPVVCEHCGAVVAIAIEELTQLARSVESRHGFVLDVHHFALTGTCARCATD
jgi:Fur family ferric uptake transcriptional regulator